MFFLSLMLFGCGGKNFDYTDSNEIKPGPGLFSGEDGVFTIIKKERVDPLENGTKKDMISKKQ
jgi:hypothetical protein